MSKWSSIITTSKQWFLKRFGNDTVDHDKNINNNKKAQPPKRVSSNNKNNVNSSNAVLDRRFSQSRRHDSPAQPKPYDELMERAAYLTRVAQGLQKRQQLMNTTMYINVLDNLMHYVNLQDSSEKSRRVRAARTADELLLALEKQNSIPFISFLFKPHKESYYLRILVAYEECGNKSMEMATFAYNLLNRVIDLSANPRFFSRMKFSISMFNLSMNVFKDSISSSMNDESNIHSALKAEEVLEKALQFHAQGLMDSAPTSHSFNCAITAWSRCSSKIAKDMGANRSYELLKNMIRLYRQDRVTLRNLDPFRSCLLCLSHVESPCGNTSGNQYETPERAEEVMEWLRSLYKETNNPKLKPHRLCWNYLLFSWVQATSRPGSMDNCFSVCERMKEYCESPDMKTLTLMFKAATDRDLGDTSLELFEQVKENCQFFPDQRVPEWMLLKLMRTLNEENRSDSFDRVEAFFNHCIKSPDVSTSIRSSIGMMNVLLESNVANKAERALALYISAQERQPKENQGNIILLNCVFLACTKTNGSVEEKEAALRIALKCFHECESRFGVKLKNVKLPRVIEAISCLAPKDYRMELFESIISAYKARQLLLSYVVNVMKHSEAAPLVSELENDLITNVPSGQKIP